MGEFVKLGVADGIGTILLNRPPVNALNDQLTAELADAARTASDMDEIRAVIIYGGEKCFAAGADINDMAEASYPAMAVRSGQLQATMGLIAGIPKPVVAAITGYALGGGLEVALAADFRVAGEGARLGQPEILLGVIPGPAGRSGCPVWSARPRPRTSCSPAGCSRPRRRTPSAWSTWWRPTIRSTRRRWTW